jgi:hypothetical protein
LYDDMDCLPEVKLFLWCVWLLLGRAKPLGLRVESTPEMVDGYAGLVSGWVSTGFAVVVLGVIDRGDIGGSAGQLNRFRRKL